MDKTLIKVTDKLYPQGGLDKYHGVHPLRERAAKLHLGIMVIRFEMPFNIWCGGCNKHIGMGKMNCTVLVVFNYFYYSGLMYTRHCFSVYIF